MAVHRRSSSNPSRIVTATGEEPLFEPGDQVRIADRIPIGHYRVPHYLRKKLGRVEAVIEPAFIDNEEEGFGRNAGARRHYYRVAFSMTEIWSDYAGSKLDSLYIEVFESWLERL